MEVGAPLDVTLRVCLCLGAAWVALQMALQVALLV